MSCRSTKSRDLLFIKFLRQSRSWNLQPARPALHRLRILMSRSSSNRDLRASTDLSISLGCKIPARPISSLCSVLVLCRASDLAQRMPRVRTLVHRAAARAMLCCEKIGDVHNGAKRAPDIDPITGWKSVGQSLR